MLKSQQAYKSERRNVFAEKIYQTVLISNDIKIINN